MRKSILLSGLLTVIILSASAQTLYWRFNNAEYLFTSDSLQFDVELKTDTDSICLRDLEVFFNYNPQQFGYNIQKNDAIKASKIGIMTEPGIPNNPLYPLYSIVNDTGVDHTNTRYGILTETCHPDKYCGETFNFAGTEYPYNLYIPTDWVGFLRFSILVSDCSFPAGIYFDEIMLTINYPNPYLPFDTIIAVNDLNDMSCVGLVEAELAEITAHADGKGGIVIRNPEGIKADIEIFDLSGRLVKSLVLNRTTPYTITNLSRGAYILKIQSNEQFFTRKVLNR